MAAKTILVTGGAGYVGAVLVPKLVAAGHHVKVVDLFLYGEKVLDGAQGPGTLEKIKGDIRDASLLQQAMRGVDAVIHLACISNDPSYELNPDLSKTINYDAFLSLLDCSIKAGVKRFIYASSSSVYGLKSEPEVTEDLKLEPLTDYSKYKALCEDYLIQTAPDSMTCVILRPATVCGYSPRLRLDLSVNILTNHAISKKEITVFGGAQKRPNIHIEDMTNLYVQSLDWAHSKVHKRPFNAGYENHTIDQLADQVRQEIGPQITIKRVPTDDNRSYHVSSRRIAQELGFEPKHTISEAIRDLKTAFAAGRVPNAMTDSLYYNIKRMQEVNLK